MFCRKCGTPLADDAKFCGKCGTATANAAAPVQNAAPAVVVSVSLVSLLYDLVLQSAMTFGNIIGNLFYKA